MPLWNVFYLYSPRQVYLLPNTSQNWHKKMEDVLTLITMIVLLLLAFHGFGKCSSDLYSRSDFPEGFVFGAGISAYQVSNPIFVLHFPFLEWCINFGFSKWEGAVDEDGRKPSFWDTFLHCRKSFRIFVYYSKKSLEMAYVYAMTSFQRTGLSEFLMCIQRLIVLPIN